MQQLLLKASSRGDAEQDLQPHRVGVGAVELSITRRRFDALRHPCVARWRRRRASPRLLGVGLRSSREQTDGTDEQALKRSPPAGVIFCSSSPCPLIAEPSYGIVKEEPRKTHSRLLCSRLWIPAARRWFVSNSDMCCASSSLSTQRYSVSSFEPGATASETDWQTYVIILLGGEAGLSVGEMLALDWTDVDLTKRQL